MKKKILTLSISILAHIGIILAVCGMDGVFTKSLSQQDIVRFVCDGFYVAGVFYICIVGLIWASGQGAFDGIGYSISTWTHSVFHNRRDWKKKESYQEYKERRAQKKKEMYIEENIIIGGISVLIASILLLVYNFAY